MKLIKKNIPWIILVLLFIVMAVHTYILHIVLHFDWGIALQDSAFSSLVLSLAIWSIFLLVRAYPTTAGMYLYTLVMAFLAAIAVVTIEWKALNLWLAGTNPKYGIWLRHTLAIRFVIVWIFNSWIATNAALRKSIASLDARFQQQSDASILLKEAELFKLRQQLQPHFLYNSLNSISALIMIGPDRAQEMIGKLSDFLRSSVRREAEDMLPVTEELAYISSYLDIEAVRFGDRLQIHFKKEYTDDATIPPFLLQPILENAIKFGLYGMTGVVNITIQIVLKDGMLLLTIVNPFDAATQPPKGTGFGLEGIRRRLYLLFGRTDLLETNKDETTFTTILKIPQHHVQSHTN